jgi:hypothetical protein
MDFYATYQLGDFQYTPKQERADGKGWEPRMFTADNFRIAERQARSWYQKNPVVPADKELWGDQPLDDPTEIMLYSTDNDGKRLFWRVAFEEK